MYGTGTPSGPAGSVTQYVLTRLRAEAAEETQPGRRRYTKERLAKRYGVTKSYIVTLLKHPDGKGIGPKLEESFARVHFDGSVDKLREAASGAAFPAMAVVSRQEQTADSQPPSDLFERRVRKQLTPIANRLKLAESVIVLLTDDGTRAVVEDLMERAELPEKVISAAWGAVHVRSVPFEAAISVARDIYEQTPAAVRDNDVCNAKWFLDRIVERLPPDKPFGSGTYPTPKRMRVAGTNSDPKRRK